MEKEPGSGALRGYVSRGRDFLVNGFGGDSHTQRQVNLPVLTTKVQYGVFLVGLALVTLLVAQTVQDFWKEMFFGAVVAFALRPLYERVAMRTSFGEISATALIVLFVLLVLIFPVLLIGSWLYDAANTVSSSTITSDPTEIANRLDQLAEWLRSAIGINIDLERLVTGASARWDDFVNMTADFLVERLADLAGISVSFLIRFLTFVALFAIMLPNGVRIRMFVARLSPFEPEFTDFYLSRVGLTTRAVVAGAIIVPAIQAGIFAAIFWMTNLPLVWILTILVFIFSVIPFLGASFVTIPLGIILILAGNWNEAILIWVLQFVVVSNVDLLLRPMVTPKSLNIPTSALLIGFVGGLAGFGIVGLFLGPLAVALFVTTLRTFASNFGQYERSLESIGSERDASTGEDPDRPNVFT